MNGTIYLSGGGDIEDTYELDRLFFDELKENSKILYIPVALVKDDDSLNRCKKWFSKLINTYSEKIEYDLLLENEEIPPLNNYKAIYIGGGNTYKLLKYIYESNLDRMLEDYLDNDGIIYGGSAGAIILGKDIRMVEEENNIQYIGHAGLGLIDNFSIICHYTPLQDEIILQKAKKHNLRVIALHENSGLKIKNNSLTEVATVKYFNC